MSHVALPHWLARVNVRFSNRFMRPIAARLPWFVVAVLRVDEFLELREEV
jgi:hypothetical protein